MQFRVCFAGQDHPGKENLRKSENHRVHECDYLIEACHLFIYLFILFIHRPLELLQVNVDVHISLNIPWFKHSFVK